MRMKDGYHRNRWVPRTTDGRHNARMQHGVDILLKGAGAWPVWRRCSVT